MVAVRKNFFCDLFRKPCLWLVLVITFSFFSSLPKAAASGRDVQFFVGAKAFTVDGVMHQMDVTPFIDSDGRAQVPGQNVPTAECSR